MKLSHSSIFQASQANSARTDDAEEHLSRAGRSHFSHSVFQPTSAQSTSTVEDDYHNSNYGNGPIYRDRSREDIVDINFDERHADDINFNFEANISAKEDLNPNMNDFLSRDALGLNSHDGKSQKLNSLANNMTSQAMSPGTKTPLLDLENAFQNLKHKMPVNQVRRSPQNIGRNISDDQGRSAHDSAVKIQRWYRRHRSRRKTGKCNLFYHPGN